MCIREDSIRPKWVLLSRVLGDKQRLHLYVLEAKGFYRFVTLSNAEGVNLKFIGASVCLIQRDYAIHLKHAVLYGSEARFEHPIGSFMHDRVRTVPSSA